MQVAEPTDRDRLRFALTGEAGLNDGTAFPFVMLGLGLLGLHDLGSFGSALARGRRGLGGRRRRRHRRGRSARAVGRLVLYLRRTHKEAVGLDNFLALGLIGLAYGVAGLAHGYGFLAVFAAGVALRRLEQQASAQAPDGAAGDARQQGRRRGASARPRSPPRRTPTPTSRMPSRRRPTRSTRRPSWRTRC